MFRNRDFLMGLGLGLVISSIFVMLFSSSSSGANVSLSTLTELKQAASALNAFVYTSEELEQLKTVIKFEILENDNLLSEEKKQEKDGSGPSDLHKREFVIKSGMNSYEVADYLKSMDLIDDKEEFTNILNDNGLSKRIIAGRYECQDDITVEKIIELITNTK